MVASSVAVVELKELDRPVRRLTVTGDLEVGRDGDGAVVDDPEVSRRHLKLSFSDGRLTVTDLGSANGTTVNGQAVGHGQHPLVAGDVVRLGRTEIIVISAPAVAMPPTTVPDGARAPSPSQPAGRVRGVAEPRPELAELDSLQTDTVTIRYRPGTYGAAAAVRMRGPLRRARRRLAGLGSEPWGARPQVCLVDPFPDPERPNRMITEGTVVDASRGEIWMVVTAEAPPELPERPLALYFGAGLPAAADLEVLLEGYGLFVGEFADPDPQLRRTDLPPLQSADGPIRAAMALSFVRYLIDRSGRDDFLRLLSDAQPGRLDAAAQDIYGTVMANLEELWRQKLALPEPKVKTGQFIRLALRYLRPHARREAEMAVYMLFSLAFSVVFPFALRRLLDVAIPSGQFSQVVRILGLLAVVFVVSLLAGLRQAYLSAYVSSAVVRQVRGEMFAKLQGLSPGWFDHRDQGDVMSRLFNDVSLLEAGLSQALRDGVFQLVSLVVAMVVLLILDPLLALVVVVGVPLVAAVYRAMAGGARRRSVAVQEQIAGVYGIAAENYEAQSVVRTFGLQGRERGRFGQASDRLFRREVALQLFGGLFGLSVNMIVVVLRIVVLGLGSWLILHHQLTIGGLVAFLSVMGEAISPVTVLTGIGQQVQMSTGALLRINEVLDAVPDVDDAPDGTPLPPVREDIRFSDVSFSYDGERPTLDHVSVTIPVGSNVAFVGPTGAGKSSVLQLLMRSYDPDEGAVLFDGRDIRHTTLSSLHQQLGVVFQDTFLFDTTIGENIALGLPGATEAQVEAAARAAELDDFVDTLPRGYDTLVGERGGRLSGGQRQRVAIARALIRNPRVLLLDEATSALDPRTERLISDTLEKLGEGRTTIAVTHRLGSVVACDCIFVVVDGRVVESGRHAELVGAGGPYAELWAEQTGHPATPEWAFDAEAALRRVHLFAQLPAPVLADLSARLQPLDVPAGETLAEGGGRLLFVRRGRGEVLVPGVGGAPVEVAELASGDCFGLAALLGEERGSLVRFEQAASLLVLDSTALSAVATATPSLAAALAGKVPSVGPATGTRLSRLTVGPPQRLEDPGEESVVDSEMRRVTSSWPALRR